MNQDDHATCVPGLVTPLGAIAAKGCDYRSCNMTFFLVMAYCLVRIYENNPAKWLLPFALLVLTSGCMSTPDRHADNLAIPLPSQWSSGAANSGQSHPQQWVKSFDDPVLSLLISEALENNFDLKTAAARVEVAIAQARIDGAGLWPQLGFAPGYQHTQVRSAGFGSARFGVFEGLFNLSWEIDLWGRIRAFREAAVEEIHATQADFESARLSLAARVGQTYFVLLEAQQQMRVAAQSVTDRSTIASLVQGRFERGLARGLDVRLARTDLANARSQLAQMQNQMQLATRQLEILLGHYPAGVLHNVIAVAGETEPAQATYSLPAPPPVLPAGLPAELLARRPDVAALFSRLRAADARLESATKLLLPRISLTASGGTRDSTLTELVDPRAVVWNVFAGAVQPLFTGGRIRGGIQLAQARVDEIFNHYQNMTLNAFREVEQTLAAEEWLRAQEQDLREAVRQTEAARERALYSYRHGFIQILTLLDSFRSTLNAQSAHLAVQRQLLNNRISLYLALGGGI